MNLTVLFTCHTCGVQRVRVLTPLRGETEDLVQWMGRLSAAVGKRHTEMSPTCTATHFDLLLPLPPNVDENTRLGAEPVDVPDMSKSNVMNSKAAN